MKLLNKITIRYLLFSLVVMALTGVIIYIVLLRVVENQVDEKLNHRLDNFLLEFPVTGPGETFVFIPGLIDTTAAVQIKNYSDTLIYNRGEDEGESFRVLTAVVVIDGNGYCVTIAESMMESDDLFESLILIIIASYILLTICLVLVVRQISGSVWRSFYNNLEEVKKFSVKNMSALTLETTGTREFNELNHVLKSLTNRIISDYENLRRFTENASHEIQTPLSVIISGLENIMNRDWTDPVITSALSSVYSSALRLSRIQRGLILITKIENRQFGEEVEIDFVNLVTNGVEDLNDLIELKNLDIKVELKEETLHTMSPWEAEIMVSNLLSNSINHNTEGGTIRIELAGDKIIFCNSSRDSKPLPATIFNRFGKADDSGDSVGLGLAIVKRICDSYNIEISYSMSGIMHCFRIEFPL